ncbi:glycosyltransferase [Pleurocapsa sp. PCC 7319]|uniref:glycosyltransferase n=1 Tax=Pleurocapsa sp. PCC 7319 TaxID=118161 RepID=UPI000348F489|nr:glycosyltransferase [Pleurocapsa sp. PCC 7319]
MSIHNSLPKIAIFIPSSVIGGAEHYIKNILYLIEEIGFEPTLVLPKNHKIINFFSDLAVNYLVADITWSGDAEDLSISASYLDKLSRQYRESIKILESLNPDCAFINLPWVDFGLGISLACHAQRIPSTNLVHLCPWKVDLNDLTKQLLQDLAKVNSNFFTVSNDNRIQLALSTGIDSNLIKVFYNSRDIESEYVSLTPRQHKTYRLELLDELKLPLNSFLSISVGRFSHQKNFLDIITSFSLVHDKLPNYYHLFLGEGELKDYYQKIVLDLGLSDQIKFLGYRKGVAKFLALSDLFISTSLYEGLALSILEAAQLNCPIVATNSSSAQEIIPSSEYGLLYNPGQYHLLAKYIEFAYFNPNKMKNKAFKLNSWCKEKFSLTQFESNLKSILQESVNSQISDKSSIPVSYNPETNYLQFNRSFNISKYKYQGLPKEIIEAGSELPLSVHSYSNQILEKSHPKYLHCIYKIAKKFLYTKVILCFGSFNSNFFRNYYLKGKYLLFIISLDKPSCVTLSLHHINHTYWGQDLEPDCLAKFTTYEKVTNLVELENINLNKTKINHCFTSKYLLNSHLKLPKNNNLNNLSINLKMIESLFEPTHYYLIEEDPISNSMKMKLAH